MKKIHKMKWTMMLAMMMKMMMTSTIKTNLINKIKEIQETMAETNTDIKIKNLMIANKLQKTQHIFQKMLIT